MADCYWSKLELVLPDWFPHNALMHEELNDGFDLGRWVSDTYGVEPDNIPAGDPAYDHYRIITDLLEHITPSGYENAEDPDDLWNPETRVIAFPDDQARWGSAQWEDAVNVASEWNIPWRTIDAGKYEWPGCEESNVPGGTRYYSEIGNDDERYVGRAAFERIVADNAHPIPTIHRSRVAAAINRHFSYEWITEVQDVQRNSHR